LFLYPKSSGEMLYVPHLRRAVGLESDLDRLFDDEVVTILH